MQRIDTKSGRDRLKPRREPYWHKLEAGRFLGYRKGATGGFWLARYRDTTGKQHFVQIGQSTGDDFSDAKRKAERWLKTIAGSAGISIKTGTVEKACEDYAAALDRKGRTGTGADVRTRFNQFVNSGRVIGKKHKRTVPGDPIGSIRTDALTRDDVEAWLARLKAGKRNAATVNRNLRCLKAALTHAVKIGYAANPIAWQSVDAMANAERARTVFLTGEDRRALLDASSEPLRVFLTLLFYTAARPGELARTTVADFDAVQAMLTVRSAKGRGGAIRPRAVPLIPDALQLLKAAAKDKLPAAPLLSGPDGGPWTAMQLSRAMREAVKAAKLPSATVCYSLRHAAISEWLSGGIDAVTVAKIAGTSVTMIEKHYAKFIAAPAIEKLTAVKLY